MSANPYYDLACELLPPAGTQRWREPIDYDREARAFTARQDAVMRYSWAVPTEPALDLVRRIERPVVEIGAGTGYWAWCLRERGVEVYAFDEAPHGNHWAGEGKWTTVEPGTPETVLGARGGHGCALLLCWPPFWNEMAVESLARFAGDTLIYVGEGPGGCTATGRFWHELDCELDEWNPLNGWLYVGDATLPQWPGMHDHLRLYFRGSPAVVRRRVERLALDRDEDGELVA